MEYAADPFRGGASWKSPGRTFPATSLFSGILFYLLASAAI